jgi:hypothetical protein
MQSITTIGLDIAKSVFQVHGVDAGGRVVVRRQLKRRYVLAFFQKLTPCLVGMEACAPSLRSFHCMPHTTIFAYLRMYRPEGTSFGLSGGRNALAVTAPSKPPRSRGHIQAHNSLIRICAGRRSKSIAQAAGPRIQSRLGKSTAGAQS